MTIQIKTFSSTFWSEYWYFKLWQACFLANAKSFSRVVICGIYVAYWMEKIFGKKVIGNETPVIWQKRWTTFYEAILHII